MAPSPQEIAAIFEKIGPKGGNFMEHADPDVKLEVMGHDHPHKNTHESHEAMAKEFFDQFEWVDWDTIEIKARQVIGGGPSSEWASVELTSVGKSKKGKPINHEFVFITRFNYSGNITEIRAYLDSAHLDNHHTHHKHG
ncbi:hypothetical protein M409DRAFT_51511 [Zasmidium cellare ATCC 36951]|uniref:SnoaL-like domain-containing protein n=1 Tax=Zasmidium cellare ATCC 36951 TaxID=1080233 RepID=A0A6A6CX95_ZASCE|nr:uncharacterized protein M409DRAFT_51511 [Zasmidium cellare ATCC 36951]KAF2170472.1 hypothetical protein M409DRAFT_51511 [Zasmidium cellare ATCC 36951]